MADELEMIEIEMLESELRREKSEKQHLAEDNERLRSIVSKLESSNENLKGNNQQLVAEKEQLQSTMSGLENHNSDLQALLADRNADLEANEEEMERMFPDIQELEDKFMESRKELQKARKENKELVKEIEKLDSQIDRITEDNTEIILAVLTTQSDLEVDLDKQAEIIRSFFNKTVEMVKNTVNMIEEGQVESVDFVDGVQIPEGFDSAAEVMIQSLAVEFAAVKRAFRSSAMMIIEMRREMEKMRRVIDFWEASPGKEA